MLLIENDMTIFIILYSLFLMGLGLLMGHYPNLISGYSTMSAEKRENVDLQAIGQLMKRGFLIIGVVTAVGGLICRALSWNMMVVLMLIIPLLAGAFVLIILGQKYDHNPRSRFARWAPAGFIALVSLFVGVMFISDSAPTQVVVGTDSVEFTGAYGVTIPFAEIEQVDLLDTIPKIEMRTNGLALGEVRKGSFRLAEWGKCRLLLESAVPPYLLIRLKTGERIVYNAADPAYTRRLAKQLPE